VASNPTPAPLRIRLDGPAELHERAAWALEALLARAGVGAWELVGADAGAEADRTFVLEPAAWQFAWNVTPDADPDPLAATFWWLARVEELLAPPEAFDEHERFTYAASACARGADPLATPVDDLAAGLGLEPWRTTGEQPWRIVATHDIDLPRRWTRTGRRRALRTFRAHPARVGLLGALLAGLLPGRRDPWDNCAAIHELERAHDAASTSYLLVGAHVPEDGDAAVDLERWIEQPARDGAYGLHGSYTSSLVDGRLAAERAELAERTGITARDHRFHYLRHRPVRDWPTLAAAGFGSDASLGFAETTGFRAGTAHPYRAWDHPGGRPLDLVVIPLALMDATFDERYLDVRGATERQQRAGELLDAVRRAGGCASVLVHNDRLCNSADDGWTRLYAWILDQVRSSGGRACTASEAADSYLALLPSHRRAASATMSLR
jgi:hypothetical protein